MSRILQFPRHRWTKIARTPTPVKPMFPTPEHNQPMTDERKIVAATRAGKSQREIADEVGCTRWKVRQVQAAMTIEGGAA